MAFLLSTAAGSTGNTLSFGDSLASSGIGLLIVFIGLICLIALVALLGFLCERLMKDKHLSDAPSAKTASAPAAAAPAGATIENRDELIVAFSAAVAEELGTDVSAIRVVSFKEIG